MRKNDATACRLPSAAPTEAMPRSISSFTVSIGARSKPSRWFSLWVPIGVAFGEDAAGEVRIAARHAADQEIIGFHAMLGQHVEHAIGVWRHRAVVEGQHDLLVFERQRVGVLHRADARKLARVHRHHPAGAERIRIAGTIGRRAPSRRAIAPSISPIRISVRQIIRRTLAILRAATQRRAGNFRRSYLTRAGTVNATRRANCLTRVLNGARHDMHNPIAAAFELAQQLRQHRRGLRLGVVQQHDAAARRR